MLQPLNYAMGEEFRMDINKKAYAAAIAYATIVGFTYLGTKTCLGITTPLLTLSWRYDMGCAAALILIALGFVRFSFKGKDLRGLFLAASFYLGFMGIQALGLTMATSIEGGIVFAVVPIFVQIIAYFMLKEKTVFVQNISILVTVFGIILLYVWGSAGFGKINPIGFLLLLLSSLSMGFSNVFMRYVRKDFKAPEVGCFIAIFGCIVFNLLGFIIAASKGIFSFHYYISPFTSGSGHTFLLAVLYLGIPCMLLTSSLITYALSHLEAVKGTVFGNLSLLISIIAGIAIRQEPFMIYHLVCTILIVMGVIGTNIPGMKKS